MAVKTVSTGTGLNVPEIVEGLMQIERRPLEKLSAKIETSKLKVSSIATFTGALSLFQQSLLGLRAPSASLDDAGAKAKIDSFIKSYNDLVDVYKNLTKSDPDSRLRGPLSGDYAVTQAMRIVTQGISGSLQSGAANGEFEGTDTEVYLSALGIRFSKANDGKLEFFPDKVDANQLWGYNAANATALIAQGVQFSSNGVDLLNRLEDMLSASSGLRSEGLLSGRVFAEEQLQRDLNKRRLDFEEKLERIQARYIAEYAALDALLFKLNNINESLKSSLDALTASQKND